MISSGEDLKLLEGRSIRKYKDEEKIAELGKKKMVTKDIFRQKP